MDIPLEIAFHNIDASDPLEAKVRQRVDKMHRRFAHINSCRVVVEAPHRSPGPAAEYHVRIETRVPDKELVVSRDPGERRAHFDAYRAVADAFDAMERQLESYAAKLRGMTKRHAAPLQGRVVRTFADHGFIATTDGREIYFHRNAVAEDDFDRLDAGAVVELTLVEGESPAGPQATTVRAIRPMEFLDRPPRET